MSRAAYKGKQLKTNNNMQYERPTKRTDKVQKIAHTTSNQVLIGDWEEVKGIDAQTLNTKLAEEKLDGLIIRGYEMNFDKVNFNGEMYDKTAYDEFIQTYFVDNGLNMPVDINHDGMHDWRAYCGRVLYCEVNTVGLYFVVYIPRTYPEYSHLVWALKEKLIQGFSKEGFVGYDDYDWVFKEDGTFDHEQVHKMAIVSVSLVFTPANAIPFEKMQETRNALLFENKTKEAERNTLEAMFNPK